MRLHPDPSLAPPQGEPGTQKHAPARTIAPHIAAFTDLVEQAEAEPALNPVARTDAPLAPAISGIAGPGSAPRAAITVRTAIGPLGDAFERTTADPPPPSSALEQTARASETALASGSAAEAIDPRSKTDRPKHAVRAPEAALAGGSGAEAIDPRSKTDRPIGRRAALSEREAAPLAAPPLQSSAPRSQAGFDTVHPRAVAAGAANAGRSDEGELRPLRPAPAPVGGETPSPSARPTPAIGAAATRAGPTAHDVADDGAASGPDATTGVHGEPGAISGRDFDLALGRRDHGEATTISSRVAAQGQAALAHASAGLNTEATIAAPMRGAPQAPVADIAVQLDAFSAAPVQLALASSAQTAPVAAQTAAPAVAAALIATSPSQLPDVISNLGLVGAADEGGVVVQLDPPELGRVSIEFRFEPDGVQRIMVIGETPEAVRQLRALHFELVQALERQGLDGRGLSFAERSLSGNEDGTGQRPFDQGRKEADVANPSAPPVGSALAPRASEPLAIGQRLNIII